MYYCVIHIILQRGLAEVEWRATGLITTCRVGHEGKVMNKKKRELYMDNMTDLNV